MKFGLLFLLSTPYGRKTDKEVHDEVLHEIELAEELGYDSVWLTEHHFHDYGRPSIAVLAGAVAARTKRVRIGTAVTILPLHHPIDLAEDFATVDVISNGRLDFGVGRGYQPLEFFVHGVSMNDTRERLAESLEIIIKSWTQDEFTYEGQYHHISHPVTVLPKPLQKPHPPLWQPVVTPSTVELLVQKGINPIFASFAAHNQFREHNWEPFVKAVEKTGKRLPDVHFIFNSIVHVAKTEALAKERAEGCMWWLRALADLATRAIPGHEDYQAPPASQQMAAWLRSVKYEEVWKNCFIGDPQRITEQIKGWNQAFGVKNLLCYMHVGEIAYQDVLESMELFAKKVMPAVRDL